MKKFLALALLTCTGMSHVSLHAMDEQNPTPSEAAKIVTNQRLQRKQKKQQQTIATPQEKAAAGALVALAITQADQQTTDAILVDLSDGQDVPASELGATQILSDAVQKQIKAAQKLSEEEAELKRKQDAYTQSLKDSFNSVHAKSVEAQKLITEKEAALKAHEASKEQLAQAAAQTTAAVQQAQEKLAALQQELADLSQANNQATEAAVQQAAVTLARADSFKRHADRAARLQAELTDVQTALAARGVSELELVGEQALPTQSDASEFNGTMVPAASNGFSLWSVLFGSK